MNGGNDEVPSVTVAILRSIRDEIVGLRQDTNQRFEETNHRLDFVAQSQVRMANDIHELKGDVHELKGDVHELKGDVHELKGDVRELKGRFEHFLETSGESMRDVQERLRRLEGVVFTPS